MSIRLTAITFIWGIFCTLNLAAATVTMPQYVEAGFETSAVMGIGMETGVCRRDPSDIIKVGDLYYVWYTRHTNPTDPSGYDATVWYAVSKDGHKWTEKGEAIARGGKDTWDEHSVFTPNIMQAEGKYWLFYTAVPEPFINKITPTKTALGMAVADSPDGPWKKLDTNPVLKASNDPKEFDSLRVDDAGLIVRNGKYWLYYKGRQWNNSPGKTKMGVAIADKPQGPYVKYAANPVIGGGHEVIVWPLGKGVVAQIGQVGPEVIRNTLQYAEDGLTFGKMSALKNIAWAGGSYRSEAFTDSGKGKMVEWGLRHITRNKAILPYLDRFEYQWDVATKVE